MEILRAFEEAGGTAGYEIWLAEQANSDANPINNWGEGGYKNKVPATMQLIPYVVGGYVELTVLDGNRKHHGIGWLWGLGGAAINSVGVFWYNDWSATTNAENKIAVSSYGEGVGAIGAHFSINNSGDEGSSLRTNTGLFVGGGGGEGFAAVGGKFKWGATKPLSGDSH